MRARWLIGLIIASFLFSENIDEALFLRRIAEFWEEGELQIAKQQMEKFISLHPDSQYFDPIAAALGDLFFKEKHYQEALSYYVRIQESEMQEKIFLITN